MLVFESIVEFAKCTKDYQAVHIFFDEQCDKHVLDFVCSCFEGKRMMKSSFPCPVASVELAERITFDDEDLVVAIGGIHVQNLAKYYACMYEINCAFVPVHEVAEYSFSKYAFVKDKYFCFFECEKPKVVLLCERFFNENDKNNLQKLIIYKNVVAFEKEFEKDIFGEDRYIPEKLVKCINLYDGSFRNLMRLFGICASELSDQKPYDILGSEYYVLALAANANIVETTISIQNVLAKLFECQMKFDVMKRDIDVNLHLKKFRDYGIGVLDVQNTILPIFDDAKIEETKYRTKAYLPYLRDLLDKATNYYAICKTSFDQTKIENALALCSGLFSRKSIIRFMRDLGYFENLLKS